MPKQPGRPCPGKGPRRSVCTNIISRGERCCPECEPYDKQLRKTYDKKRGSSASRGYDHRWRQVREMKLNQDPLCELCLPDGIVTPADMVHHIKPVETHPELRLAMDNLQSLCNTHHEELESKNRWGRKA